MPLEGEKLEACFRIPDAQGPVLAPRGDARAVGAEGDAADQYAAAATLYFLLTGQSIYEPAPTTMDLMVRILNDEPIPLRRQGPPLPPLLGEVVRRALAHDPRRRFPDVLAMREALAKCR